MQLTRSELAQLERGRSLPNLQAAIGPYIDYYVSNKSGAYAGGVLYDVLVPLYYQYPELFTVATGCVDVACESGAAYGKQCSRLRRHLPSRFAPMCRPR